MATSGTTSWILDVDELVLDAVDMIGGQPQLGYNSRQSRRALNMLFTEFENRGIPLWKLPATPIVQTLVSGTATYTLDASYVDVIDGVSRVIQGGKTQDIDMLRLSLTDYLNIPNKQQPGRPTQYMVNRQRDAITVTFYQVPDSFLTYYFVYWPFIRIEDVTNQTQNMDIPYRFYPAASAGLAYYLSLRIAGIPDSKKTMLLGEFERQLGYAQEEDRERVTQKIIPYIGRL